MMIPQLEKLKHPAMTKRMNWRSISDMYDCELPYPLTVSAEEQQNQYNRDGMTCTKGKLIKPPPPGWQLLSTRYPLAILILPFSLNDLTHS